MPAVAKVVLAQRDFSAGELDPSAKRNDENPVLKIGGRQMANWRILNSRAIQNRSGRRALFKETGRVEEVTMSPGNTFFLCFGSGTLRVYNSSGTQVFTQSAFAWALATVKNVVWCQYQLNIYITFPAQQPQVLTWDGVSTWSVAAYAETVTAGNQKRTFFYRISPQNITMLPAAQTGAGIACTFSAGMNLVASHVNTRMRFCGRQILITAVGSSTTATITIEESLPGSQVLTFGVDPTNTYSLGDLVEGTVTNSTGIVTNINSGASQITVQLTTTTITSSKGIDQNQTFAFTTSDNVVGAGGSLKVTAAAAIGNPGAVSVWDDEVMNSFRGWPASCFFDQGRLGFCNFNSLPRAIGWSAIGLPNDLYVDGSTTGAMLELAPNNSQVFFVVAGPESSEFVFCDNRVYWIPISVTSPLKSGSVAFNQISGDGALQVQPRLASENIIYINAGGIKVKSLTATGSYTRPYETDSVSELHAHLFKTPIAIAVPNADGTFDERYAYVLNSDGTIAVGKYTIARGTLQGVAGWLPWSGAGTPSWISSLNADLIFTTSYAPNGISAVSIVEILDDTYYLDGAQLYNTQPAGLPIPGGKGPLWWLAGGTVDVMDGASGTRMMGTYTIDANGNLVAQNNAGENFASANLRVGQKWTATFEPFVPAVQPGQDANQRMRKRRILRAEVYVQNSTGFIMQRLYAADPAGRSLPAIGTVMKTRRIPAWNQDDDPTQPPTLREQSYLDRPIGRAHDPRWATAKDTPGPLTILELGMEVTV